jgi:type II secretory pathway component PulC
MSTKAHELLQTYREKLQSPLVAGVVIALIALGIANTLWNNITNIRPAEPVLNAADTYNPPHTQDINTITNAHLMGASPASLHDLPLASLGVSLLGVFINPDGQSSALVSFGTGETKTYFIGDALAANVVIEKILPDSVIVKHNGRLEKLQMAIQPIEFSDALPNALWPNDPANNS